VTFEKTFERTVGGKKAVAYYWGPAHTNSDAVVYFPDLRVVVAGDILHNDGEPSVDALEGKGSLLGLVARLDDLLALDFTLAVPGHGDNVMTRAEVMLYRDRTRKLVLRGKRAVACGIGPEGLREAMRSDDLGFRLAGHLWNDPAYVRPIHDELARSVRATPKAAFCKRVPGAAG
jgi:glyoxylase-like metal-dependent hydrolase (beta-lactamase superfamily II)